ncbi:MAG TPA: response regulator transcription factor [Steroidobacteraceae bacterium]|nr:response regulator transcription factor [Steroidobacteraceae bacterium]
MPRPIKMRILLVEDNELVADAIVRGLAHAGFTVDHALSAERARAALHTEHFDLAVVDIGLPAEDGLSLLGALRQEGQAMPVLILTARDTLADKIRAFDLGADDFLMKPFEQAELAARCRALIRRASLAPSGIVRLGRMTIDLSGHQLQIDSQPVELTRREWLVLESLAHNIGRIVTKDRLMQALAGWEQDLTANAVETHISRLRAKLGAAALIRTVRGLGYRLDEVGETPR